MSRAILPVLIFATSTKHEAGSRSRLSDPGPTLVTMRIGAHVREDDDPIGAGERLGAEVVQLFLTDPQKWNKLTPHPRAEQIRDSAIDVVVHSSYVINVASLNNRIRIPSRKSVA